MGYKVLIVDDEEIIREGLKVKIDWFALGVDTLYDASDGMDAIEKTKCFDPDIVITDIKMPVMDGLSMVEEICRFKPECKFVLVSGYADFEYAKKAVSMPIYDYLLKPIDAEKLVRVIMKIIVSIESTHKKTDGNQKIQGNELKDNNCEPDISSDGILTGRKKIAKQVKEYIDLNYSDNDLNLKKFSRFFYLTPHYIRRSFKAEFSTNLTEYITYVRMQHAKELIESSNLKFSSLCQEVGFKDASYFCKCFKKYYGLSPREYMNKKRYKCRDASQNTTGV